jgi:hypothetical protein
MVFGVELRDAREEVFAVLVCDGLPMGLAFKRAGFESKDNNAPALLFNLPRVQEVLGRSWMQGRPQAL